MTDRPVPGSGAPGVPFLLRRVMAVLAGLGCLGYGTTILFRGGRSTDLGTVLPWLVGVLVAHDAVLAPLAVAAGTVLARALLPAGRGPLVVVAAGGFVAVCLVLLAVPALLTTGVADNPTATPRDYPGGLLLLLGLDAAVTAVLAYLAARRGRGQARR